MDELKAVLEAQGWLHGQTIWAQEQVVAGLQVENERLRCENQELAERLARIEARVYALIS